ncbi:DUF6907 domain-containing protein [Streptomyces sp. NPDC058066]|uniref:DUF6907 domain-containing protein n=1 Tax=Streptomyces sp. NPDC058066 TaxID=3346323 RepID=UPI0036E14E4B
MSTTVQAALKADVTSTPRLVAALIGRPSRSQTVFIECPSYCTEPHGSEPEIAVEDISHASEMFGVQVPTMFDPNSVALELFARVYADPAHEDERMRDAHILVGDGSAEDAHLTPATADELVSELRAFTAQLGNAIQVARRANGSQAVAA